MRTWLEPILGGLGATIAEFVIWTIAVLVVLLVVVWVFRRYSRISLGSISRGRVPRLAIVDAMAIDRRRRLVLIRRDNLEHLILIGGPTDIVVEPSIHRPQMKKPAGRTAAAKPGETAVNGGGADEVTIRPLSRPAFPAAPAPPMPVVGAAAPYEAPEPQPPPADDAEAQDTGVDPDTRVEPKASVATGTATEPGASADAGAEAPPVPEPQQPAPAAPEPEPVIAMPPPEPEEPSAAPQAPGTAGETGSPTAYPAPEAQDPDETSYTPGPQPAETVPPVRADEPPPAPAPPPGDDDSDDTTARVNELEREMARLLGETGNRRQT